MRRQPTQQCQTRLIGAMLTAVALVLLTGSLPCAAQTTAKITATVLNVTHRPGPQGTWRGSRVGTQLPAGSRVRTGKRSRCEIKFPDGSIVRMGARSDLVIKTITDKDLTVQKGRLLAHIIAGTAARITGASATAAIKGTWVEYVRGETEEQEPDILRAWEGSAEMINDQGTTVVTCGTEGATMPDEAPGDKQCTPPRFFSGRATYPWWLDVKSGVDIDATPGTPPGQRQQRGRALMLSALATVPSPSAPAPEEGELDVIVQQSRRSMLAGPGGGSSVWRLAQAVGGMAAVAGQKPEDLGCRYFDPHSQADTYGLLSGDGSFGGARVRVNGLVGKTYGQISALAFADSDDDATVGLGETFIMRRTETDELTAGRQRVLVGPVNNSELGRLMGFGLLDGVRWHRNFDPLTEADLVWIDDFEPLQRCQASGWLLHLRRLVGGGEIGINCLKQNGADSGVTLDFSWPALRGELDIYGEFGDDPHGAHLDTIGLYLPGLYQRGGPDVFLERARRQGYPSTTTLLAYQELENDFTGVALARKVAGKDAEFGIGVIKRFGYLDN